MVKRTITITTILLILSIVISIIIVLNKSSFAADGDIASGTSGTCSWVIDSEGVLTISPTDGVSGTLEYFGYWSRSWREWTESINKVVINPGVKTSSNCSYMFRDFSNCTEMDLLNLDTTNCTNMNEMFMNCSKLKILNLKNFNTSKVTDMSNMFSQCKQINSIDVSSFDTSKVTNMFAMFSGCSKLTSVNVAGFNTTNVTSMNFMFSGCEKLETIDVSNFDTSKVTTMNSMFQSCNRVTNLDVSRFDTSKVYDMAHLFFDCYNLKTLDVSNWNTSSATSMSAMFHYCYRLKTTDVSKFDTRNVKSMAAMFSNCSGLENIDVSNFDTSKVTSMEAMFQNCKIKELDVSGFKTSNTTNTSYMFSYCTNLTKLDVSKWDTSQVTDMGVMFQHCSKLSELDLSNFDTSKVTDIHSMFYGCKNMEYLDISNFNTSKVTDMEDTFNNCDSLCRIKLGENFSFKGNNISDEKHKGLLPSPKENEYYTGKWILDNKPHGPYLSIDLRDNYDGSEMSGIWRWERQSYCVSYSYIGDIPNDASELPTNILYEYGEEINTIEDATLEGYTFSGWNSSDVEISNGTFKMPAKDVKITGYFIEEPRLYKIEYYFDNELDEASVEILNAEKGEEINLTPQTPIKHGEKNYTLVSNNHKITISVNDEDNVIRVYYETDILDYAIDNFEDTIEGDGIPDKYQISITYKVENGSWNDGTTNTKTDIITLKDKDGNLSEEGTGTTTIPEVGNKPSEEYEVGSWNEEIPKEVSNKDDVKEYIYSYKKLEKQNNEQKEKTDITETSGKIYNPKTDDIVNKYLLIGIGGILVLALVSNLRRKYSKKAKKIQY